MTALFSIKGRCTKTYFTKTSIRNSYIYILEHFGTNWTKNGPKWTKNCRFSKIYYFEQNQNFSRTFAIFINIRYQPIQKNNQFAQHKQYWKLNSALELICFVKLNCLLSCLSLLRKLTKFWYNFNLALDYLIDRIRVRF